MRLDDQIRRIARGGEDRLTQIKRLIRRLYDRHALNRALFYGDDGLLKPEAVEWFAALADNNFVHSSAFHVDAAQHAYQSGRRDLAMEILNSVRFDSEKLDQLSAQAKEMER